MAESILHYHGCTVKGLPVGVPFRINFFIPEQRRESVISNIDTFVILPMNSFIRDIFSEFHLFDCTRDKDYTEELSDLTEQQLVQTKTNVLLLDDLADIHDINEPLKKVSHKALVTLKSENIGTIAKERNTMLNKPNDAPMWQQDLYVGLYDELTDSSNDGQHSENIGHETAVKVEFNEFSNGLHQGGNTCSLIAEGKFSGKHTLTDVKHGSDVHNPRTTAEEHPKSVVHNVEKTDDMKKEIDACAMTEIKAKTQKIIVPFNDGSLVKKGRSRGRPKGSSARKMPTLKCRGRKKVGASLDLRKSVALKVKQEKEPKKARKRRSSSTEYIDYDVMGNEKVLKNEKRKRLEEKQKKEKERVKVRLSDHTDKYTCEKLESFARKDRAKDIDQTAFDVYVCNLCRRFKVQSYECMEQHIESHVNKELECTECSFIACYVTELQKHQRDFHVAKTHVCSECGEICTQNGLLMHMGKVHSKPQYECKFCQNDGRTVFLVSRTELKKHKLAEHPVQINACTICHQQFACRDLLEKHVADGCTTEFPCEYCGKVFKSMPNVKRHIQILHWKVRRYQCPYCPFTAPSGKSLERHEFVHSGIRPYKCDQCTFTCVQSYQLTSHLRTHTGDKPFKCDQCSYAAAWKVQLKDHYKAHLLMTAVTCHRCGIVFKNDKTLSLHVKKEHFP